MYYEIYIDQFCLEHLLTGYLLLYLTAKVGRAEASGLRVLGGSAINTVVMLLSILAGKSWWYVSGLLFSGLFVFYGGTWKETAGRIVLLFFMTICFGGAMQALMQLWRLPVTASAVFAVAALFKIEAYREKQRVQLARSAQVEVTIEGKNVRLYGLVDTGNQLTEPLTGRPVSIVEEAAVGPLLGEGWEERRGFFLIPYHSLGTKRGWMKGVTADCMTVERGARTEVQKAPVLALYDGKLSAGKQYRIILHPQHAAPGGQ